MVELFQQTQSHNVIRIVETWATAHRVGSCGVQHVLRGQDEL